MGPESVDQGTLAIILLALMVGGPILAGTVCAIKDSRRDPRYYDDDGWGPYGGMPY